MIDMSIKGILEVQRANEAMMRAISPTGALGKGIKEGTQMAHRYAQVITHVDTGSWKASHRMSYREAPLSVRGEVFIDPTSVNPVSLDRPEEYATFWEKLEGSLAVYKRTVDERGESIVRQIMAVVQRAMPR